MFTHAIVRPPGSNFKNGLTTVHLGVPDYRLAQEQHQAYCAALESCGIKLIRLPSDERFPDSTFVEDNAIITPRGSIFTAPGAASRKGEIATVHETVVKFSSQTFQIEAPGTLDGGDVVNADGHYFIGISHRTNEAGAQQLSAILTRLGYSSAIINIRDQPILHLSTGMASLGDNRLTLIKSLAPEPCLQGYQLITTVDGEEYAANCLRVNDNVILAAGFRAFEKAIQKLGFQVVAVPMSEFSKQDGGLTCLSLRF
ncbi:MAG TPA: arginine deiminase family protein [Anaerolineae bacterium]